MVGETAPVTLTDDAGLPVVDATWTASNPGAATISTDPDPVVTALGAGTTTLTATKNGLTAEAVVTVAEGPLADGTVRWAVPPSAAFALDKTLHANRVDPSVPDLFVTEVVEEGTATEQYRVLGVTSEGAVQWSAAAPGMPVLADTFGGVVTLVRVGTTAAKGLARLGGPPSALPWRYDAEGDIYGTPAQAPDGTLYVIERGAGSSATRAWFLSAFNGQTGQVRARTPIPRSIFEHDPELAGEPFPETCDSSVSSVPSNVTQPVIGADGRGYVQVVHLQRTSWGTCNHLDGGGGDKLVDYRLVLLGMDATGATTTQTVFADLFEGSQNRTDIVPLARQTMPDGLGGLLLTWETSSVTLGRTLTRFDGAWTRTDTAMSPNDSLAVTGAGDQGTVYVTTPAAAYVRAIDTVSLATLWTTAAAGTPIMAGLDRTVAVQTASGFAVLDNAGQTVSTAPPMDLLNPVQLRFGLWTGLGPTAAVEARVSTPFSETTVSFAQATGGPSAQRATRSRIYTREDRAAVEMMEFVFPESLRNGLEFTGRICKGQDGKFEWGRVGVGGAGNASIPITQESCPGQGTSAYFHTHTGRYSGVDLPSGYASESEYHGQDNPVPGSDLKTADSVADAYPITIGTRWWYLVTFSPITHPL